MFTKNSATVGATLYFQSLIRYSRGNLLFSIIDQVQSGQSILFNHWSGTVRATLFFNHWPSTVGTSLFSQSLTRFSRGNTFFQSLTKYSRGYPFLIINQIQSGQPSFFPSLIRYSGGKPLFFNYCPGTVGATFSFQSLIK